MPNHLVISTFAIVRPIEAVDIIDEGRPAISSFKPAFLALFHFQLRFFSSDAIF
jgi:hypothetical protein